MHGDGNSALQDLWPQPHPRIPRHRLRHRPFRLRTDPRHGSAWAHGRVRDRLLPLRDGHRALPRAPRLDAQGRFWARGRADGVVHRRDGHFQRGVLSRYLPRGARCDRCGAGPLELGFRPADPQGQGRDGHQTRPCLLRHLALPGPGGGAVAGGDSSSGGERGWDRQRPARRLDQERHGPQRHWPHRKIRARPDFFLRLQV
mmetsp:Transcript_31950/g.71956  ORF Transcript_31950/g.71956 Transcript_31950/m.71956 type:complete len:201 (+) Transcript_31950:838-1440(+)